MKNGADGFILTACIEVHPALTIEQQIASACKTALIFPLISVVFQEKKNRLYLKNSDYQLANRSPLF
jgi:hypothetical protein